MQGLDRLWSIHRRAVSLFSLNKGASRKSPGPSSPLPSPLPLPSPRRPRSPAVRQSGCRSVKRKAGFCCPLRARLNYAKGRGGEIDVLPHHPGKPAMGVPSNPWLCEASEAPTSGLFLGARADSRPHPPPTAMAREGGLSAVELGLPGPLPSWRHPQKHSAILVASLDREAGLGLGPEPGPSSGHPERSRTSGSPPLWLP